MKKTINIHDFRAAFERMGREAEHRGELDYDEFPFYGKSKSEMRELVAGVKRQHLEEHNAVLSGNTPREINERKRK